MSTLSEKRLAELLAPYLQAELPASVLALRPACALAAPATASLQLLYSNLLRYLDLLLQWNARTNLTAIRSPEQIAERHFGESLFIGRC